MSEFITLSLNPGDRMEDIIGKIEIPTDISPKAKLAYNILSKHPGMVTFHTDYVEDEDGKIRLIGVCMDIKQPGTQKPNKKS